MTLGQRIQKARNWRGWSQRKLAAAAGCDASTVGAIEADENEPGVFVAMRIANALGMTTSQAIGEAPMNELECAVLATLRTHRRG